MTVDLAYDEAGAGPAVVLLHAFPLSSAMWARQRAALADSYRVITPDQRGFGRTPLGDGPPSLDTAADDVAALLDRLGLDRVVLGGLSMGGYVAMAFVRRHAERLRGLVLADTKASADPEAGRANRERIAQAVLGDPASSVLVDDVLPALTGTTTKESRPEALAEITALLRAAAPEAVAWAQRAMAARPDSLAALAQVTVPTLVVVGAEDTLSPVADAEAMAAAVPGARLEVLPAAGHLTALETPDELTAVLRRFLDALPG